MKKLGSLALCLLAGSAFAANTPVVHFSKGMIANNAPLILEKPIKAQLNCNIYSIHFIDDNHRDVKFLGSSYGQEFNVGTSTDLSINFPAPYSNLTAFIYHTTVAYGETGLNNFSPFLAAEFFDNNTNSFDAEKEASFSVNDARSGSKITLRGVHGISDDFSLFYQCSITFLK